MIRLGGLVSQKAFGKFEMGKVISNPFAKAFVNEAEGEDHEVSMGQNQLDTIIKMATELKAKMGENEKEIPAWIQDHISKAENYISQAAGNYHEYGTNESINEAPIPVKDGKYHFYYKDGVGYLTYAGKEISSGDYDFEDGSNSYWMNHSSFKGSQKAFKTGKDIVNYFKSKKITTESVNEARGLPKMYVKYMAVQKKVNELEAKQKEMAAKYFAEKELNKKAKMLQDLKKGTEQLASYRRNLAAIEDKYVTGLYADAEYEGE